MKSIVVFGMAHSGKSTCIGYMLKKTKEKNDGFDFEKYIVKLKENISEYDSSRDFGYLVDEFIEERIKTRTDTGASKQVHLKPIQLGDAKVMIIDTPGSEHRSKERQKGMYYGDIGVFCIEIMQLTSDELFTKKDLLTNLMTTLVLWEKFNRRTIIALTKMDMCNYNEETYLKGCEIIKQLCEKINVSAIIPISINVKARQAHNILSKSVNMDWYKGETLEVAMLNEMKEIDLEPENTPLLFYVDRNYLRTKQHIGQSWRIKIIQGNLDVGQEIFLSPVRIYGEIGTVQAKIKSIKSDLARTENIVINTESASQGSFIGIDLYDIRMGNRTIRKSDLSTVITSCGFSTHFKYKISDTFIFRTNFQNLAKCNVNRQMSVLWFGRAITFQVVSCNSTMSGIEVTAKAMGWWITMPLLENGEFLIKDLIIKYDTNPSMDPFLEAELVDII